MEVCRFFRSFIISSVLFCVCPLMYGQDANSLEELVSIYEKKINATRDSLNAALAESMKKIDKQSKEIEELQKKIRQLSDDLNKSKARALKDSIVAMGRSLSAKDSEIRTLNDSIDGLHRSYGQKIDKLTKQIALLEPIKKQQVEQLLNVESDYVKKPYVEVDIVHIDQVISRCDSLAVIQLESLVNGFMQLRTRKVQYDSLALILASPYDEGRVDCGIAMADSLKSMGSEVQKKEVESLRSGMELYKISKDVFPRIIQRISSRMRSFREPDSDMDVARITIDRFLKEDKTQLFNYNKYIAPIPYLAKNFDAFKEELLGNPLEKTFLEKELNL